MGYVEQIRQLVGHRPLILVGGVAVICNDKDEILLQQRYHPQGRWAFPGGLMELGESVEDTTRREIREETSLELGRLELLHVYSGPEHFITAPNDDEYFVVTVVYIFRDFSGILRINDEESMDLQFRPRTDPKVDLVLTHQRIYQDFLASSPKS